MVRKVQGWALLTGESYKGKVMAMSYLRKREKKNFFRWGGDLGRLGRIGPAGQRWLVLPHRAYRLRPSLMVLPRTGTLKRTSFPAFRGTVLKKGLFS